jgi:C4-dicarboxylate-specific signal transduction histidine kinase
MIARTAKSESTHSNRVAIAGNISLSIAHEVIPALPGIVARANTALRWLSGEAPDVDRAKAVLTRTVLAIARIDLEKHKVTAGAGKRRPTAAVVGLNLVMNASEYMHSMTSKVLRIKSELDQPEGMRVSIEDSGTGIDPQNTERHSNRCSQERARDGDGSLDWSNDHRQTQRLAWAMPAPPTGSVLYIVLPVNGRE